MVVFLWRCVLWWCFCSVGVVVFLRWCFFGGVVVFLWWWCFCGGVFVVFVWWCFYGGVAVFLWWCCFCGGVFCGGVYVVVFL